LSEFDVPVTLRDATRVIHAGLPAPVQGAPFLPGPVFASAFHAQGGTTDAPFAYTREGHPTWENFERALGELEGGSATLFASGVAAIAAVFAVALRPGDVLAIAGDAYYGARGLAKAESEARGIGVREVVMAAFQPADLDGARLVWFESPSNPNLDVCDVAAIVRAAHERGALVAMDNTTATMLAQRPLEMGVDFSMMSDTKSLCGHADLLLGHVAVRDPGLHASLRDWRRKTGAIAGPMEAWLAHRSLATLSRCGSRVSATTPYASQRSWRETLPCVACAIRACPAIRRMHWLRARCAASVPCWASRSQTAARRSGS
jgi:cystathionine gamma-lyase